MTMSLEQTINTEPLLTIMGIVAAAWAIIPRTRLLQISLNLSWIDWALTGFALLLANYLTFEPLLSSFNLYYSIGPWPSGLDSASATYLLFLTWLIYAFLRSKFGRLPRNKTKKFKELIDRLIATRQHDELALIVETQLDRIIHIAEHENPFTRTLEKLSSCTNKISPKLSEITTPNNEPCITAYNTIHNIVRNPNLVNHLSLAYPNICMRLIRLRSVIPTDFSDHFIDSLIRNTGSQLYMELANNKGLQDPGAGTRLHIPDNNILVKELLSDPHVTIRQYGADRAIWRTTLYLIENDKDLINRLNTPSDYYTGRDEDHCPINASISMFNIMVHEGIHKGYQDHMNMRFLYHLTNNLLKKTTDGHKYNFWTKTPIRTLIDRIIYITMDWIQEGAYVDNSLAATYRKNLIDSDSVVQNMRRASVKEELIQHRTNDISGGNPDNLFISNKATELLNEITQTIVNNEAMSNEWKELCLEHIINQYKSTHRLLNFNDKDTKDKLKHLADLMLEQVIKGNHASAGYRRKLLTHVKQLDIIDRKPLFDRLLKAIEEDEAKKSSH